MRGIEYRANNRMMSLSRVTETARRLLVRYIFFTELRYFTLMFKNDSWQNATDKVSSYIVKN